MKVNRFAFSCLPLLFVISACAGTQAEAMQRFVYHKDMAVSRQENIGGYLKPKSGRSGVSLEGVQEVQPGVMEYSFIDKLKIFVSAEKKCRFILIAQKDTGTIIGWRYNGNPEYCTANP
ncbi:MAG: hypothetical protein ACOY9D_11415 [Pseudomonadota bacterium]